MKILIAFALFLSSIALSGLAHADYFQILDSADGNYIQYAQVYLDGKPYGYTDRYGRIEVDRPNGTYAGEVAVRDEHKTIEFNIDGSSELKRVSVQ